VLGGSLISNSQRLVNNSVSFVRSLGQVIPSTANFYITYVLVSVRISALPRQCCQWSSSGSGALGAPRCRPFTLPDPQALITVPISIIRPWGLLLFFLRSRLVASERSRRRLWAFQRFDYGNDVPNHTLTVVLLLTFSVMQVCRPRALHLAGWRSFSRLTLSLLAAVRGGALRALFCDCLLRGTLPAALRLPRAVPERRPLLAHRAPPLALPALARTRGHVAPRLGS